MGRTIGKKVLLMISALGILLIEIVLANVSALSIMNNYNKQLNSDINEYFTAASNGNTAELESLHEELISTLGHSNARIEGTYIFDIGLIVVVIIAMAIVILIANKIIAAPAKKADRHLTEIVEKLRDNRGDLTERIKVESRDEIGHLVTGINGFIEHLQGVMQLLQNNTVKILNATDDINYQVKDSSENAVNVSAATEQLSASMQEISATLDEIATGSKGILEEVQNISHTAGNGAEMVKDIKHRATDMYDETVESKETATSVINNIRDALTVAVEESKSVQKINELTDDILSITSQTNLLALNASIEAARAGEAGKGFSVVASEIGKLAQTSTSSVENIVNLVNQITQLVNETVTQANQSMEHIQNSSLLIQTAVNTFDSIFDNIHTTSGMIAQMMNKIKEVDEVATNVAAISEEQAASTETIQTTSDAMALQAQNIADSSREALTGAKELSDEASLLMSHVQKFKLD